MGRVFEAVDQQLGRHVALKLIREELNDPSVRDRFLREARASAVLSHPNACQLFEVSEHEGMPFLVMELLEGEPLSDRLARGRMTKDEAIGVALPLMDVLSTFHASGLIHRDLKPSNVFLTPQGVKLLDFGLARRSERADAVTAPALTNPGAIAGTMRYMAPEQLTGDPVDARTDIFALGIVIFEMLTGHPPFGKGSNADWLNAVLTQDPPSLEDPEFQSIDPIVKRALQRRPDDRYTTVEEMSQALRALGNDPATAPPPERKRQPKPEPESNGRLRTVVMPFRLLQTDTDMAVLQNGIPEALTALLSQEGTWHVLSNRVAQEFLEATDLVAVGRSLRADRLLTGSILRAGDEVRVTVQLIDAADGSVQWSQTSEHVLKSVLALQDAVCKQIMDNLPLSSERSTPAGGSR
jgi:serine/threonine protein kinase